MYALWQELRPWHQRASSYGGTIETGTVIVAFLHCLDNSVHIVFLKSMVYGKSENAS
jgi:hypothetical protein